MEREELLMQIVEKQKEYISYLSKAIDSESILCAITLGVRSNYESELASLTSQLEKTEKPTKPAELSEEIVIKFKKDDLNECHYFCASNMFDFCKKHKIKIDEPRNSKGLFDKFIITLKTPEQKVLFYGRYINELKEYAQSHQVSQVQMTDQQIEDFAKDYCSTSVGSISPLFESGLIVGLRLARDGQIPAKDKTKQDNCIQCGKLVGKSGKLCDECNCK